MELNFILHNSNGAEIWQFTSDLILDSMSFRTLHRSFEKIVSNDCVVIVSASNLKICVCL